MELLLASLAALALGPLAVRLCAGRSGPGQLLDAFILVSILWLVGLTLLPNALQAGGASAAVVLIVGFWLPGWLENRFAERTIRAHDLALALGVLGLALHSLVDGIALAAPTVEHIEHGEELASAVLIHRLPVGMTVWWLLRDRKVLAWFALSLVALGTWAGFAYGDQLVGEFTPMGLAWFQAILAGSLLHVVVHRSHPIDWSVRQPLAQLAGAACAGLVLSLSVGHHESDSLAQAFIELAGLSAPALLLGYLGAGLLFAFVPAAGMAWLGRGSSVSQAGRGMLFGLPLPVCSCGVLPLYHSLVRRGVPSAAAFSFLVATPELGLDAIILSMPLLGVPFTITRVLAAALIAVLVGLALSWAVNAVDQVEDEPEPPPTTKRWQSVWRTGFVEVLDETGPWVVFGLGGAALLAVEVDLSALAALPDAIQLPLFALIGLPVYVCASGATPLVAVLIGLGVSPGAALVFLLTGPATNVTTFGVLSALHGRRVAIGFATTVVVSSLLAGSVINSFGLDWGFPELQTSGHEMLNTFEWLSLVALGILLVGSLWRQGVRGFVGHVLNPGAEDHDHDHDDYGQCAHSHDE